jgi:transposase
VVDRFHVVRPVCDAMQHVRVKLRWKAIEEENIAVKKAKEKGEKYSPEVLPNGDTTKELPARSRHLLYAAPGDWTANQAKRAKILFGKFPEIKTAHHLTLSFRAIYANTGKEVATHKFQVGRDSVAKAKIDKFNSAVNSLEYQLDDILNFFDNRNTNANAESFNSKIKGFRANLRGVTDIKFFLFRLKNSSLETHQSPENVADPNLTHAYSWFTNGFPRRRILDFKHPTPAHLAGSTEIMGSSTTLNPSRLT